MFPTKRALALAVVIIVAALYFTGRLDYLLYNVGLNFHTCARNGFGATFCGSDLTAYQDRIRGVQQQVPRSQQQIAAAVGATTTTAPTPATPASTSGSLQLSHLANSTEDQAAITITHACGSTAASCIWYGSATQYPGGTPCPAVIDTSHVIWTGSVQQAAGTVSEKVAFQPLQGTSSVEVCPYVHDAATGDQLVH